MSLWVVSAACQWGMGRRRGRRVILGASEGVGCVWRRAAYLGEEGELARDHEERRAEGGDGAGEHSDAHGRCGVGDLAGTVGGGGAHIRMREVQRIVDGQPDDDDAGDALSYT